MNRLIATSRNDELLLAAVLAGVAFLFLAAGAVSAAAGRRRKARKLEVTERDEPDDTAEPSPNG